MHIAEKITADGRVLEARPTVMRVYPRGYRAWPIPKAAQMMVSGGDLWGLLAELYPLLDMEGVVKVSTSKRADGKIGLVLCVQRESLAQQIALQVIGGKEDATLFHCELDVWRKACAEVAA